MVSNKLPGRPIIVPRDQHCVSRKNISEAALKVLYTLHNAGFQAFLVGGAVRDLLLQRQPKDFDVATDARPEQVRRLFRHSRIIGRRFRLAHVYFGPDLIEVATFRGESDEGDRKLVDGRLVRDNVWGDIEEDSRRRDFRVNALYYDISNFTIIDYVGGLDDIKARQLKLIGTASERYREDPVRMLRAARLSAKLDFSIARDAYDAVFAQAHLLHDASTARLFDEFLKLFMAGFSSRSFAKLEELALLPTLFPDMVRQLTGDAANWFRPMLQQALENTDERVNTGSRVTPAFLLAVFLWPDVCAKAKAYIEDRHEAPSMAWQKAGRMVVSRQVRHVAIPRRFSHFMDDVWQLQQRLQQKRTRKRVARIMQHPRFRAAYDFLLLRGVHDPTLLELGQWWTHAQEIPHEALMAELDESAPAGRRRKRRRRAKSTPSTQKNA